MMISGKEKMFNQIAKEINDEIKHNGWSYKDLIWDLLGSGVGVSVSNVLD